MVHWYVSVGQCRNDGYNESVTRRRHLTIAQSSSRITRRQLNTTTPPFMTDMYQLTIGKAVMISIKSVVLLLGWHFSWLMMASCLNNRQIYVAPVHQAMIAHWRMSWVQGVWTVFNLTAYWSHCRVQRWQNSLFYFMRNHGCLEFNTLYGAFPSSWPRLFKSWIALSTG